MSRNGVRKIGKGKIPTAKVSGIIQGSDTWKTALIMLEGGQELSVSIPEELKTKLSRPGEAFLQALRRWNQANGNEYRVYARKGVIYAVKKEGRVP